MIRSVLFALLLVNTCLGLPAVAADLPLSFSKDQAKRVKLQLHRKKAAKAPVKAADFAVKKAKVKAATRELSPAELPVVAAAESVDPDVVKAPAATAENPGQDLELSWFLDSLVANADGPKGEDSASVEGNLIVAEPGFVSSPFMVIELSGHIVKTAATTVRVDVRIGNVQRSISWSSDEVKSGRFSIAINAPMKAGALPGYIPVSALAFVTREGKQGAAMISLEQVRVRLGKVTQVAAK